MKVLSVDRAIGALALGGVLVMLFSCLLSTYKDRTYVYTSMVDRFWSYKTRGLTHYDFVVIGDSRVYRGVDPEVVGAASGLRGVNLGYSSGGFGPLLFELAEAKLDNRGARTILVGITPHAFTEEGAKNVHLMTLLAKPVAEALTSAYLDRWFHLFAPIDLNRTLRGGTQEVVNYIEDYRPLTGFIASDYVVREPLAALSSYRDTYMKYKVSHVVEESFIAKVGQWKRRGLRVLAFVPPVHPSMRDLERVESGFMRERVYDGLRRIGVGVFEPPIEKFESYDGSHLTAESAQRLSALLGARLADDLTKTTR